MYRARIAMFAANQYARSTPDDAEIVGKFRAPIVTAIVGNTIPLIGTSTTATIDMGRRRGIALRGSDGQATTFCFMP